MAKIEARYYNFLQRFMISSGLIYIAVIFVFLEIVLLLDERFDLNSILLINSGLLLIILLLIIKAFNETKHYLSGVIIDQENVSFKIYEYDKELPEITVPLDQIQVSIIKDFIARYRRYRLEIRKKEPKSNTSYKLIHKQYEIGFWKIGELKKIVQLIQDAKGK